jgi:stalled ribosome rescue protein Dom34
VAALGVDDPQEGPAVDVLVRAAVATGAQVHVVPHEPSTAPQGGVGAVLRYADDAAARA